MENEEMLEQTNETENAETQTAEEIVEGIELTDTAEEVTEKSEPEEEIEEEQEKPKMFTQDEVDKILKNRLARKEREYQKELSKYKDTENVLKSTIGGENIEEVNTNLRKLYEEEGVKLPDKEVTGLSKRDLERLAIGDAEDIIEEGYDSMIEEANRLANIGYENLNEREQIIFNKLASTLTEEKNKKELLKLGASEDILTDKSFNDFKSKFNSNVPIKEIYEMYMNNKPKRKVENPGSMKNSDTNIPKEYYTEEEIAKLTEEQLDDPKVWAAVRNSMTKNASKNYYE